MDSIALFLAGIAEKMPWLALVLGALGSLVVIGQAVVVLTPSKKDDEAFAKLEKHSIIGKLLEMLKKFAVIQKK